MWQQCVIIVITIDGRQKIILSVRTCWLISWMIGRLVGWLVGGMVGWWDGWSVGRLAGWILRWYEA